MVKDVFLTTDNMPSTAGCSGLRNATPSFEATVIKKLREKGAVLSGETNLSQWNNYRNYHAPGNTPSGWSSVGSEGKGIFVAEQDPRGCSSGSAVAVALGLVPVELATETQGSNAAPACSAEVVGLKPTSSVTSRHGHMMEADEHAMEKFEEALLVMVSLGAVIVDDVKSSEWDHNFCMNPDWVHSFGVGLRANREKCDVIAARWWTDTTAPVSGSPQVSVPSPAYPKGQAVERVARDLITIGPNVLTSIMFVGRRWDDYMVIAAAHSFEKATQTGEFSDHS
ncbi:uncharacterized protein RCO7_06619 [Rhynchosporium graminicola]|uniref:Amidase domain-containing protein n=1 Tax=Rhynchosporium graminicola TaxID=2792576 RepID=A0A1E1K9S4_9HELO|nr:uncharacterized protein RCO7_06619 [Rhynchosporium commune]